MKAGMILISLLVSKSNMVPVRALIVDMHTTVSWMYTYGVINVTWNTFKIERHFVDLLQLHLVQQVYSAREYCSTKRMMLSYSLDQARWLTRQTQWAKWQQSLHTFDFGNAVIPKPLENP